MHTTIEPAAGRTKKLSDAVVYSPTFAPLEEKPSMIVLQPCGALDCDTSPVFQKELETSLELALEGVIVDLLWLTSTDSQGVAALAAGIQQANVLGKSLSFQSMDLGTQTALEAEWLRQRESSFGPWQDSFGKDLEQFLDNWAQA